MKIATPKQMREIDAKAIKEYDIPGILLMEHAAYHVFQAIKQKFQKQDVFIICGPGNNGGDGLALARQIFTWTNYKIKVVMLAREDQLTQEGRIYYQICTKLGIELVHITEHEIIQLQREIQEADIIIDALFGTGLTREIVGLFKKAIQFINNSKAYKISIDMPSGIQAETGKILGAAVKADLTITFELPKIGLCIYPGIEYTGELKVVPIGIPKKIIEQADISVFRLDENLLKNRLPIRPLRSNKGDYGRVLVIGGSCGMAGAITLTATSCMKIGAGVVTVAVPTCIYEIVAQKLTEAMTIPLPSEEGHFSESVAEYLKEILNKYTTVVIGPGIGRSEEISALLEVVLESNLPCVIDADGLYALIPLLDKLEKRNAVTIITPHPGEMSALTGLVVPTILENTLEVAKTFSNENNVITVLKTERTIVATENGELYINTTGNPGMAKGGSGDVLAGMIAGLVAQRINPVDATTLGVYLHGRAGDIMAQIKSSYAMLPSDLYEGLEHALKELLAH